MNGELETLGNILEVGDTELLKNGLTDFGGTDNLKLLEMADKYPESLMYLLEVYIDFCKEVIINRALPAIDGLKPVHRRLLYIMQEYKAKNKGLVKSQKITSDVMGRLHPHGDSYDAFVKMVDSRNAYNIPLARGKGNFGSVYSSKSASAPRYTEAELHSNAEEFFRQMDGVDYVPSFDEAEQEPVLLPVSYPSILVNATQGIAVGIASNIPSFNILDVLDATIEYLETGKITKLLIPDFSGGGTYIKDEDELKKIMTTGKGKIKLRGNVEIEGKEIAIKDLPFGVTAESLKKQIENLDDKNIVECKNLTDRNGMELRVYCATNRCVHSVLMRLYKDTKLQDTVSANMRVIVDGEPKLLGAYDIIAEWCKFRKGVMSKQYAHDTTQLEKKLKVAKARYKYLEKPEIVDRFIEIIRSSGKAEAKKYLSEQFKDLDKEEINSIASLGLDKLADADIFKEEYEVLLNKVKVNKDIIEDPTDIIIQDLRRVKGRYASYKRKTLVTDEDYEFVENEDGEIIDDSPCYVLIKDNFLKKVTTSSYFKEEMYDCVFETKANETLVGIDNYGRVLRVYLKDIPYCLSSDTGTYLPVYFNIEDSDLLWIDILSDTKKMLLYNDGRVGFLDLGEWYSNSRCVKVIEVGVSAETDKLVSVMDVPESIIINTNKGKFAIEYIENIPVKSRTARKMVFKLDKDERIVNYATPTREEAIMLLKNQSRYSATKPRPLATPSDLTDTECFVGV